MQPPPQGAYTVSFVLQQQGSDWKLGGFYAKPAQISGHDGNWFADRAREFKSQRTAPQFLVLLMARPGNCWSLSPSWPPPPPTGCMTRCRQQKPADLPPLDLTAGGKDLSKSPICFPIPVGHDFDLVVRYQSADVSDTGKTFQDNTAVMKALVAKYPEFRDAFAGIVARAVEPSGRDYGSMLAMKDIK